MKRIPIILTFLIMVLCLNSCNEDTLLNFQPVSELTSAQGWMDESMAQSNIAGLMNDYRGVFNGDSFLNWFERRSGHWRFGFAGSGNWQHLFNNSLSASSSPGTNWGGLYSVINGANLGIKYIPDIRFRNEDDKNRLLAQVYFIRAYTYYTLVRIYGDAPLVLTPFESVDTELFPSRRPASDIFDQIKQDIDTALELMPDASSQGRVMPSEAAIEMLKTDVYIWSAKRLGGGEADLLIAEDAVNSVLDSPHYRLLNDYEQVFRQDENDEIIFAIKFAFGENENQYGRENLHSNRVVPPHLHNNPIMISTIVQRNDFADHFVENYLKKNQDDVRFDTNYGEFFFGGQNWTWINKFIGEWRDGFRYFTDDTPIYRYAEAILFKAEILNARGRPDEAITYLNMIAERAYGDENYYSTGMSQDDVDDAILDERLIEFAAEGKSWMDYIRMGKAFERIPTLIGRDGEREGNILLFPIALSTIQRNPNITQTPGY